VRRIDAPGRGKEAACVQTRASGGAPKLPRRRRAHGTPVPRSVADASACGGAPPVGVVGGRTGRRRGGGWGAEG